MRTILKVVHDAEDARRRSQNTEIIKCKEQRRWRQHTEKLPRETHTIGESRHILGIPADEACSTKYRKSKQVTRNSVPIVLGISWEMASRKVSKRQVGNLKVKQPCYRVCIF